MAKVPWGILGKYIISTLFVSSRSPFPHILWPPRPLALTDRSRLFTRFLEAARSLGGSCQTSTTCQPRAFPCSGKTTTHSRAFTALIVPPPNGAAGYPALQHAEGKVGSVGTAAGEGPLTSHQLLWRRTCAFLQCWLELCRPPVDSTLQPEAGSCVTKIGHLGSQPE